MQLVSLDLRPEEEKLHRDLTAFNRRRLTPTLEDVSWELDLGDEHAWRLREGRFVERERANVKADFPTAAEGFVAWFEELREVGPGQGDPLFPWLECEASFDEMKWFVRQEVAGEAGFDDLVALTQVKLPARPKLELARNYWDEMGQGNASGMHGPMLGRLVRELEIDTSEEVVWESLAVGNLMTALACNRRYAYQSLGALGVIELTAPGRAARVNAGLKRLEIAGEARRYFALHATLDVKHSIAWNREVIMPLVAENPRIARAIAEGALMRLEAGRRCFDRYRTELGVRR
jgi:hypothetical protein